MPAWLDRFQKRWGARWPALKIYKDNRAMLFRNGTHLIDLICFFAESELAWLVGVLDADFDGYGPRDADDGVYHTMHCSLFTVHNFHRRPYA